MDNFSSSPDGYDKTEVNNFVEYVISKTEENIKTIKSQQTEILYLRDALSKKSDAELDSKRISLANKEAELIIMQAKTDADKLINDALIKSEKINRQKEMFTKNVHIYKKKLQTNFIEQMDVLDEIEIL